ncbi:hypothetical protein QVD17_06066 [Tagetes erecta]|uniref:FRIGIDA-like protein n=1 Tax=Tagetes erecta TaxID=13708 RepID=A0AAD8LJF8_TARER|nr:hypothetical protein QVD17_06066 [Tagetes erecta]
MCRCVSPRFGRQQLLSKPKKPKLDKVQPTAESAVVMPVLARPELKSFCENSDGSGLMRFISLASRSDQRLILSELPDAYQCTPDAPAMVLDAMVAFYNYSCRDTELLSFRSGCMIMLEGLLHLKPDITIGLKNKAMEMAVQWNQKRVFCPCEQKALGFVLLVGAYGLIDQFSIDDIADCFLIVATDRHTTDLYMIQKLIDEDMIVTAVKFSIELQKTVEFPPVVLLEELKLRSMRVMEKKRRNVKYLDVWNSITMEEIGTLRSIIDCVEENHLEAEYPKDSVIELVNNLENEMENGNHVKRLLGKEPPRETLLRLQLLSESKKPKQNKFKPIDVSAATMHVQSVKLIQESHSQKPDLSPDHVGQCYNSPHVFGPNGFSAQFACPIVKLDGSTRADVVYNFYAPQLQPFSDSNSNGWISD